MWTKLAHFIIKNRLFLIIAIALMTVFMGFKATEARLTFKFAELVPKNHPEMQYFKRFQGTFGEDANVFVLGFQDSSIYQLKNFSALDELGDTIKQLNGVTGVMSIAEAQILEPNRAKSRFDLFPLFDDKPDNQKELEDKLEYVRKTKFYERQLFNPENGATLLMITLDKATNNSERRVEIVHSIEDYATTFTEKTGIEVHFAGLPYVRTALTAKAKRELKLFIILSLVVTAMVLLLFFRSFKAVIFPMIVIAVVVVWTMGSISLFGYEITMLSGLVPSIIVVIGIPNCVYLLNKYHQEYAKHGSKIRALSTIIRKTGIVTLITNCTTAIGFLVLLSTDITILREFGIVAGVNVMVTFVISIILIPAVYTYLPPPQTRHLKHLDKPLLNKALVWLEHIVMNRRSVIYSVLAVLLVVSSYGAWKIYAVSYIVDDIPEEDVLKKDLRFFEKNFGGVMPLEVVVNTGDPKALRSLETHYMLQDFEMFCDSIPELSKAICVTDFIKAARQSYWSNDPMFYEVPTRQDKNKILLYLKRSGNDKKESKSALNTFFDDSTGQVRISLKVADIGSQRMDSLVNQVIIPMADSLFGAEKAYVDYKDYDAAPYRITGTTLLFIKGNAFLIKNLRESLFVAILLISLVMALLFRSVRIILLSLATNIVPLIITAAVMGYFGIPLKPSTVLIFSIAFGIAVDDSIHFLAKYRQELQANNFSVVDAVSTSVQETGASMIYTSIILFFGFIIFSASSFQGTVMLGVLTSTTLLMAMLTNLIVLPSLLMTFDDGKYEKSKAGDHPLIDDYNDNQYREEEHEFDDLEEEEEKED